MFYSESNSCVCGSNFLHDSSVLVFFFLQLKFCVQMTSSSCPFYRSTRKDKSFLYFLCCVCHRMYVLNVYFAVSIRAFVSSLHNIYSSFVFVIPDDTLFHHFHKASHCRPLSLNLRTYSRAQWLAITFSDSFPSLFCTLTNELRIQTYEV